MVSVPVYVAGGKFGSGARLMLKFIASLRDPLRLLPRIGVEDSWRPAFAPPNGTVLVRALKGPALSEIWKSADGMLFPAPSVNAAVELEKNAYSFRLPTLGLKSQVVVAVTDVLPGLLALPTVKLKFTAGEDSETVMESLNTACKAMVVAPEFSTCARAPEANAMAKITIPNQRGPSFAGKFIEGFCLVRRQRKGGRSNCPPSQTASR